MEKEFYCYEGFCNEDPEVVYEYISLNAIYAGEEGLLKIIENEVFIIPESEVPNLQK